ncbi:MAG TPA: NYN domain-containing protein [Thermoanaerobaculia bacterium]|nr:NYN domain-containing protein [Thermoanaerobaculia bacterium]
MQPLDSFLGVEMSSERVTIFIDGSNLYHCAHERFARTDVDFVKLSALLTSGRKLVRTYYYNASVRQEDGEERYRKQQQFFERLRLLPYFDLRLGRLERRGNTVVEKGIDVRIATDMLLQAHQNVYDTAVLISGDADLVPAVEAVKSIGKHVELACVSAGRSRELMQTADLFVDLDPILPQAWRQA